MPSIDLLPHLIWGIVVIALLILYLMEYQRGRLMKNRPAEFEEEARVKSYQIIHEAIKKSQEIVAESEIESSKIRAQAHLETKKLQADFLNFLEELKKQSSTSAQENQQAIQQRTNEFFEKFEQNLSGFLTNTQQQSTQAITLELQAARNLIETYKNTQLKLVDENIVAMLERTLSLVLVKKLSLNENMDLIYESLEKAKAEKFIV